MDTAPLTAKYDGRVLVPDGPLDAVPGAVFEIKPRKPSSPEEWRAYLAGIAGSWADLDYEDPEELPYDKEESVD